MLITKLESRRAFVTLNANESYPDFIAVTVDHPRRLIKCTCPQCGVIFYGRNGTVFCSQSCKTQSNLVVAHCEQCGIELHKTKREVETSKHKAFFCSRKCKDTAQSIDGNCERIRPSHYGDGKWEYAERALRRQNYCDICGEDDANVLVVHHINQNRGDNKLGNLRVLCANCHTKGHRTGIWYT